MLICWHFGFTQWTRRRIFEERAAQYRWVMAPHIHASIGRMHLRARFFCCEFGCIWLGSCGAIVPLVAELS